MNTSVINRRNYVLMMFTMRVICHYNDYAMNAGKKAIPDRTCYQVKTENDPSDEGLRILARIIARQILIKRSGQVAHNPRDQEVE